MSELLRWSSQRYFAVDSFQIQTQSSTTNTRIYFLPHRQIITTKSATFLPCVTGKYRGGRAAAALVVRVELMKLMEAQSNGDGDGFSTNKSKYETIDSEVNSDSCGTDFKNSASKFVLACAVFASLNSILLGYDVGVMSGAIIFIQEDLKITEVQEEVLVGILSVTSLLGSLAGGRTADAVGRKWTIALASLVFQMGAVVMTLAPSLRVLMAGRVLAGVGIGLGVMITPIYIAEISPSVSRGSLTSFPEIFINFGILLGYISNYSFSALSPHLSWRLMLAAGIFPSLLISISLLLIPESPRWLVMKHRIHDARVVLLKTNPTEAEADNRLAEIQKAAGTSDVKLEGEKAVWWELLHPSPSLRRTLIAGCGIQCFQQITGIDATVYYSPTIFSEAGMKANSGLMAATVVVGFTKTVFIIVAVLLIDRVGRKPLLYMSTVGMTVCLFCLGITLSFGKGGVGLGLAILCVCGNVAFFSLGIGPVCWVISSEIFPMRLRAQAVALGGVGNRVCSGIIAMSFLSAARILTVAGTFFLFSAISALSVAFVVKCVPETKGKTLEEIEMLFRNEADEGGDIQLSDAQQLLKLPP